MAGGPVGRVDLAGYSTAVESYEYSKQPMNNIAFESGAGTSLVFGPVLSANGATGADALQGLRAWEQQLAVEADTTARTFSMTVTPENPIGWPGFWPTLQPFTQWDPSIKASNASTGCTISSDDDPGASGALHCDDYECDYSTLHLPNRAGQVNMTIGPGASGWAGWKEALWALNYLQVMHDANENPVTVVPDDQLSLVGTPGNTVFGLDGVVPGTFLGSSDIEGFQAGNFLQILDNSAAQWLSALTTTDGTTLAGFASLADGASTTATRARLRRFPGAITVTEAPDASGFPRVATTAIASPDSDLLDLAGVLGAFSSVYSLTDQSNTQVGGSQPALAYFDGDPFPVQNQTPTGAATLHDRALGMMRVAVVNMDRLHLDSTAMLWADHVALAGGSPARGTTLSTDTAAYTLLALRTARRALDSQLVLYSNTKPDAPKASRARSIRSPRSRAYPSAQDSDTLIDALAAEFYDQLTVADGHAFGGWDASKSAPTDDGTSLDAHTAAIRGLLVAYLSTGATKYRDRAFSRDRQRLESNFYDPSARVFRPTEGDSSSTVTFTPRRFGLLQAALRDTYELIGSLPGNGALEALLEDRVARLNKLVLNGWDDSNEDQVVAWPDECAQQGTGPDGMPLGLGGLQMAERVLSGESGSRADTFGGDAGPRVATTDREHDCVPEISVAGLPSALANSITFTLSPIQQP